MAERLCGYCRQLGHRKPECPDFLQHRNTVLTHTPKQRKALIEAFGKVYIKTVSVADLQHYAQDAGKSKAEINKIKTPETQYRFVAKGIRVKSL